MTTPNTSSSSLRDELGKRRRGPVSTLTETERKERNQSQAKAAALAAAVLKSRHKAEYDDLYQKAKQEHGCA